MVANSVYLNKYTCNNVHYPVYNAVHIDVINPKVPIANPVYGYPVAQGQIYYPQVGLNSSNRVLVVPSGVDDYNNYAEYNRFGNKVVDIQHYKDGDSLIQKISTVSPDGTSFEKLLKNSPNFKSMNILVKDINGNILLSKDKFYKKIDDDKAQTAVNGKVYNISGLSGDVINVEHNGQVIHLDLNKMLVPEVKLLKLRCSPDKYQIRKEPITKEEKEKLFGRIKKLDGDDLFRLAKCVEHLQFLDNTKIDAHFVDNGRTLLLSGKDWENSTLITKHELGHATNHLNPENLISNDIMFKNLRNYERMQFRQNSNMTKGDKYFSDKFLYGNPDLDWGNDGGVIDPDNISLLDETFAESYNNLNTMDIIHYEDEVIPSRIVSMYKYMPRTMVEVEKLSQI